MDICEKIDKVSRKKFGLHDSYYQTESSHESMGGGADNGREMRHLTPGQTSKRAPHSPDRQPTSPSSAPPKREPIKKPSRRADFDGISENDLIANGLYALTPQQLSLFNNFTDMISNFDNSDMVRIY